MRFPKGLENMADDMRTLGYNLDRSDKQKDAASGFGNLLRAARSNLEMETADLAGKTGLSEGVILILEQGHFHPDRVGEPIIESLEQALGKADADDLRLLLGRRPPDRGRRRGRQRGR